MPMSIRLPFYFCPFHFSQECIGHTVEIRCGVVTQPHLPECAAQVGTQVDIEYLLNVGRQFCHGDIPEGTFGLPCEDNLAQAGLAVLPCQPFHVRLQPLCIMAGGLFLAADHFNGFAAYYGHIFFQPPHHRWYAGFASVKL